MRNKTIKKRQRGGEGPPYKDSKHLGCTEENTYRPRPYKNGKLMTCRKKKSNEEIDSETGYIRIVSRERAGIADVSDYSKLTIKKCPVGHRRNTKTKECQRNDEYFAELERLRRDKQTITEQIERDEAEDRDEIAEEIGEGEDVLGEKEAMLNDFEQELKQKEAIIEGERRLIETERERNVSQLEEITQRENELFDSFISAGKTLDNAEAKIAEEREAISQQKSELEEKLVRLEQNRQSLNEQQLKIENVLKTTIQDSKRILEKNTREQKTLAQKRAKLDEEERTFNKQKKVLETLLEIKVANAESLEAILVTQKEENEKTALRLQLWEDELRVREQQRTEGELAFFELSEKLLKKETELNEREFNVSAREEQMNAKLADLNDTKSHIENVLKPMVLDAARTAEKNQQERNRLNSDSDKLKQERRNFELDKDQIIKETYAQIEDDLKKVKAKQAALFKRENEFNTKNESLEKELGKAKEEVIQDRVKLEKERERLDIVAARRREIFGKLKAQLKESEEKLKENETQLETLRVKLVEEIKKAEEREGAFQGNVNRLFFLPKTYGLSYIQDLRKQYYPLIEDKDIAYFFDFDQTISDEKGGRTFKKGDSVTKFTRGGQQTLDMLNGFTENGLRWYIATAKYPDAVKSSVYSNIAQRGINLSKVPIVEGDTFQEPQIQEADNNFGKRLVKDADLRVAEMSDFQGKKTISYFNNVLTTSPDKDNAGLDKWYSVRFVLDNMKQRGEALPKLILFTDDSATNIYNLFKLEGLPQDFFYGISFMGVIYEPNGVPEGGFYEAMEKINNEKQFKLIYPDDYIVEGPAMTEYQIMEYQLRRETKYGSPIEEGEKEEPVVLSKQKLEKIMNIISGLGQNKRNLPKISEAKFREFLKVKGVPVDDQNVAQEGDFNKLCEEVKQILVQKGIYDPKKPDESTRYFLNKMEDNKEEEVREEVYNIYREFLPPVPSYDVEYDDPTKMRKSYALQNTIVLINGAVAPQILVKPENAIQEVRPWVNYLGTVGNRVLAKEYPGSNTLFAPGKITAVFQNPTKYDILSSNQKKDVKESVKQCLEHFLSVPKLVENRITSGPVQLKPIKRENLIQLLKRRFGPGQKFEDATKYALLPKEKEEYAEANIGINLIDTATYDDIASKFEKSSVDDLLKREGIQVGKQLAVKKDAKKVDPSVRKEEIRSQIRSFEGRELSEDEEKLLDGLRYQLSQLEFRYPTAPAPAPATAVVLLTDEQVAKYKKMKSMNLPEMAIRQKMAAEGIPVSLINAFFEAPKGGKKRKTRKTRKLRKNKKKRRNTKRN
jgi:hypothetical protein